MTGSPDSRRQSRQSQRASSGSGRQSIPLQDLGRQQSQHRHRSGEAGSLADRNLPAISTYWEGNQFSHDHDDGYELTPSSPFDASALQAALPPEIHPAHTTQQDPPRPASDSTNPYITRTPYYEETPQDDYFDSDRAPLTSSAQPISGAPLDAPQSDGQPRDSFQTVSDIDNSPRPGGRATQLLGFDLENNPEGGRHRSYGQSLAPRSPRSSRIQGPTDALYKAGSIVRAMSQRVVNVSGEAESIEKRQQRSRSPSMDGRRPSVSRPPSRSGASTSYQSQLYPPSPIEKKGEPEWRAPEVPLPPRRAGPMPNPLKGRSLGIFPPDSFVRRKLCDVLVHRYTEPMLLLLIVLQAVLLVVESAHNVFREGYGRKPLWNPSSGINWAILVIFIIFSLEIVAHVIVSGFILNPAEYSTIDRKQGFRKAMSDRYNAAFRPQRHKSVNAPRQESYGPSTFARSLTMMHVMPETVEEQMRLHLARRAFLRHGFNRLDFVAVVSFWIAFALSITGLEKEYHLYIFRMLSCLRIIRLLSLTKGTAIILQSLKKAAPLLLRVAFLIGFFWLLFAIVGVQSFKSSLSRHCVWLDPLQPLNLTASYSNDMTFCGGHIDNITGKPAPWVKFDETATGDRSLDHLIQTRGAPKGFICPQRSICLEQDSPFNGTVSFDNIIQSLELVFVIMSANTWSDLMYYTTNSDYQAAALFFGAGIMIMMLWLTNLLIAVITTSFQVIREESRASAFTADDQEPLLAGLHEPQLRRTSTLQRMYNKTSLVWVLLIAFDIFAQAWRSSNMDQGRKEFILVANIVVTSLLDVEIAIRIMADWRSFHRKGRNLADLFLAVVNTIIIFPQIRRREEVYAWLTIFQILRVYRVVLAVPLTRDLILLTLGNVAGIGNLILFVFLITWIMAIFAVQLFRGEIHLYDDNGDLNNISFYNIWNSFLGMYQILSSENWTDILYNVTSYTKKYNTSWYGAIFLIGWFILSFFILVNMFIAVIQENFDVSEDEKRLEQVKAFLRREDTGSTAASNVALSEIFGFGRQRQKRELLDYGPASMEMLLKEAVVREFLDDPSDPLNQTGTTDGDSPPPETMKAPATRLGPISWVWNKLQERFSGKEPNPFYSNTMFESSSYAALDPRQMARQAVAATAERRKAQKEYLRRHPTYNNALYILTPRNPIRRFCQRIVGPGRGHERFGGVEPHVFVWHGFSGFIYAAILAMVVIAFVTTPLYQKEHQDPQGRIPWFVWADLAFAVLFTIEAMIKIIADGLFFTPNAYYRSSWGFIDAVVLITLWINVVALLSDRSVSRAIGAFKALRALRLLNISNSARDIFHSLIVVAGWKIISAALVSLSLLIPFAIYAVNLFSGKLLSCNDGDLTQLNECFGEYLSAPSNPDWELLAPRVAENPFFSFDDFASSLFILFQIVSQEGWVDVSFAVQSITGPGLQPQDMASLGNAVFTIVFNLLGTVFVLTLFISVFMRNYAEKTGVAFLTADQRSWLELRKLLRNITPSRSSYGESESKWKKWCYKRAIEKRGKWYTANTAVLVLHLILLLLEYYPEPWWWSQTRGVLFLLFTIFYLVNIVVRIVGRGWARFRKSSWDVFSLFTVIGAFATSVVLIPHQDGNEAFVQLHKGFLVGIVLLLIPRNDALDQLFKTAAASLGTIFNLLVTWLIFFSVFAIALTQTFSLTRFGPEEDAYKNVRNVPNALILLFRMSVGEGWNAFMEDYAQIKHPFCVEDEDFFNSDCGHTAWARVLFVAWNLISMYIFVNLFISLIYESFSYVYQRSNSMVQLDRDEQRRFKEAWRSVDPEGTGFISKEAFPRLLGELSGVFEMRIYDHEDSVGRILEDVRNDHETGRHSSIGAKKTDLGGIDLKKLKERMAMMDTDKIRERRRRYNLFYEEVMVSADPVRGISFTQVLMHLAHYNMINDSKCLKLDEFLRRRARLQRVQEEVHRRTVLNFFDTLYYSRQFRRHMEKKRSGRMTAIPQLDVPEILVDDESDRASDKASDQASDRRQQERARIAQQRTTLAVPPTPAGAVSSSSSSNFLSASDATRQHRSYSLGADISTLDGTQSHDPSGPRATASASGSRDEGTAFSFDIQGDPTMTTRERQGSEAVSPAQLRSFLDDSVWVESIRRSATVRKSVRRSDWMGR
ncbi:ion transporter [Poronia punctata]|nr:ion transporter [Poronia punctata]